LSIGRGPGAFAPAYPPAVEASEGSAVNDENATKLVTSPEAGNISIMWLDRLAAQASSPSSSQPPSRAYSPIPPRRSASGAGPYLTSQRPGINARSSSLSVASADSSSSSLLASTKRANGSALKQSSTVHQGPDPVEVLSQLLGEQDQAASGVANPSIIGDEDFELDFDFRGLSLRELALSEDTLADDADKYRPQTADECTFSEPNIS
jgi:vacuolar protein sorting-associated protein 52